LTTEKDNQQNTEDILRVFEQSEFGMVYLIIEMIDGTDEADEQIDPSLSRFSRWKSYLTGSNSEMM